ncbi:hypothetical protein GGX14DRAFT_634632 [Mycena pura]|uniref:Uncharacterized protein n=1 Tax=Mycena pura TaxID=153505 RepID=A0AAD6Y8Z4_9AGAR|nr:hypothetical protein GGX14DRAFT_634632 [Mycena pura]
MSSRSRVGKSSTRKRNRNVSTQSSAKFRRKGASTRGEKKPTEYDDNFLSVGNNLKRPQGQSGENDARDNSLPQSGSSQPNSKRVRIEEPSSSESYTLPDTFSKFDPLHVFTNFPLTSTTFTFPSPMWKLIITKANSTLAQRDFVCRRRCKKPFYINALRINRYNNSQIIVESDRTVQAQVTVAAAHQLQLSFLQWELAETRKKCGEMEEQIFVLRAAEQRAQKKLEQLKVKKSRQLQALTEEKEKRRGKAHNLKLKERYSDGMQTDANGGVIGALSMDLFDIKADDISETAVQVAVESLNHSIVTFIANLLEETEELATRHSDSRLPSVVRQLGYNESAALLQALAAYSSEEKTRDIFLEANLSNRLLLMLDKFFSGDVVPQGLVEYLVFDDLLSDLTKHHPWTVAQRWRSLTSGSNIWTSAPIVQDPDISRFAESTAVLFAWVYHQPPETFQPLTSKMQTQLASLFDEAQKLAIVVRRDVLSVRMKVAICPVLSNGTYASYNPELMNNWPNVGVVPGDEVIGFHGFGLKRQTEEQSRADPKADEECVSYLIKPTVITNALLRWASGTGA